MQLPSEDLKEIMTQVAHLRVTKGWEFCLPYDHEFVERYHFIALEILNNFLLFSMTYVLRFSSTDIQILLIDNHSIGKKSINSKFAINN